MEFGLVIGILLFLGIMGVYGYHKGFIRLALSMFVVIIALLVSYVAEPFITSALRNTSVYQKVSKPVREYIEDKFTSDEKEIKSDEYEEFLDGLPIPKSAKDYVYDNTLKSNPIKVTKDKIIDQAADRITYIMFHIIVFLILFIIMSIALRILIKALDIISKLPIINFFNKILGMVLSLGMGLIIIWILSMVLLVFGGTKLGGEMLEAVNRNPILSMIYDYNLLMSGIIKFLK